MKKYSELCDLCASAVNIPRRLRSTILFGAALIVLLSLPVLVIATGGVFSITKHGNPATGVQRDTSLPRGDCAQCHVSHSGQLFALFAPNTNALCYTSGCHNLSGTLTIFQGPALYDVSSHAMNTFWPGFDATVDNSAPLVKPSGDSGKCINCHDPHGYNRDGTGLIPNMVFSREEKVCVVCHDGTPASDVKSQFNKMYKHPIATSGKHAASENNSSAFGFTPTNNRHAECIDCHNAHVAKREGSPRINTPPDAPNTMRGVSRVSVTNGTAGIAPIYTYRGPSDTTLPFAEYEVCFKCHSSWTTRPANQVDLALLFNSNNPSYHPVEAQGKNININVNAFVNGWNATKLMYCSDCHGNDDLNPIVRGPHGSAHDNILTSNYPASSGARTMASNELCFNCHRYDTYANDGASSTIKGYSRFNPPTHSEGHTYHVARRRYPCYACHDSHGSTTRLSLIITGRVPGIKSYTQTSTGGTCSPTCHGSETYKINYSR
jgi:predicted CXXCH cytochrome family protein